MAIGLFLKNQIMFLMCFKFIPKIRMELAETGIIFYSVTIS